MMQAKYAKNGFTNTVSGKMNMKTNEKKYKQIDLDDYDVQMLSPQFLQAKTLKKPFKQLDLHLQKTNPNGIQYQQYDHKYEEKVNKNTEIPTKDNWVRQNSERKVEQPKKIQLLSSNHLDIKPAYKKEEFDFSNFPQAPMEFKDKNSLISVLMKKGESKVDIIPMQINVKKPVQKKVGPAQTKLKSLFKKQVKFAAQQKPSRKKQKEKQAFDDEIGEEINISLSDDYGNESFEKISGSGIRESIRQSIGGSSGVIKQSIREQIKQSIAGGSSGMIKQSIRQSIRDEVPGQSIGSYKQSFNSYQDSGIKEEIMESIKKSKDSSEEVYEQIFEDEEISDELSKSRISKLKKSRQDDRFELSVSQSKGFRTKTNSVMKSIKLAQQLSFQSHKKQINEKIQQKVNKGDKLAQQIVKQKAKLQKIQSQVGQIFDKRKNDSKTSTRNKDLFYKFRVQINKLITSQNFMSKLRRITKFINTGEEKSDVNELQDKLLKNVLQQLESVKKAEISKKEVLDMKKQYDQKLQRLLKEQQMTLRVQMDQKLHERDLELKKMIAELQKKFSSGKYVVYGEGTEGKKPYLGEQVQIDSDYSIDSMQVSWKMDLWEVLPDYEKKKLYEKQANQITKLLTQALFQQIKDQQLQRSVDISFQFPDDLSLSGSFPEFKKSKHDFETSDEMFQPTLDRKKLKEEYKIESENASIPPLSNIKKPVRSEIPMPLNITGVKQSKQLMQKGPRDTISKAEIIKILSKYKNLYMKKKNDIVRKIVKTLQTKTNDPMSSLLNEIKILNEKDVAKDDIPFVKNYEQAIIWELVTLYNKNCNRKNLFIEQEMRKMYERFVVTCQVKAAEVATQCPVQIIPNETYIDYRIGKEEKKVKDDVVNEIVKILAGQFAKQMPKRKR